MKKYTIYLDFDGTVVEHDYLRMGRPNYGFVEPLMKLQNAGHEIILNTTRIELSKESFDDSIEFFDSAWMFITDRNRINDEEYINSINIKIDKHTDKKLTPWPWDWKLFHEKNTIFIDDWCSKIPLKQTGYDCGMMVNWDELDKQFEKEGLYENIA